MPRLFNVEGELYPGKRIKCSEEHESLGDRISCTRTHEVAVAQQGTKHTFLDEVVFNGTQYRLSFTGFLDASGWYIQQTNPIRLGRSEMDRTYYIAYCPDHIPEEASQRVAYALNEYNNPPLPALDESGENPVQDLSIDFTSEVSEPAATVSSPFVETPDMPIEYYRACDNCYYGGLEGGCPQHRNCDGYSLERSNWTWIEDYNGRETRIAWHTEQDALRQRRRDERRREHEAQERVAGEPAPGSRSCSNCYYGLSERTCPGACSNPADPLEGLWVWRYNDNPEAALQNIRDIRARGEEIREQRAFEAAQREMAKYTTGIWSHHSKGGRL